MAVSAIKTLQGAVQTPTISFGGVVNGAGRQCTDIDNTTDRAPMCMVGLKVKAGTTPTANTVYKLYLVRRDANGFSDDANAQTAGDVTVTVEPQSECIGSVVVTAATGTVYDRNFIVYDLPIKYAFVIWNATGVTADATNGSHALYVTPMTPEAQ